MLKRSAFEPRSQRSNQKKIRVHRAEKLSKNCLNLAKFLGLMYSNLFLDCFVEIVVQMRTYSIGVLLGDATHSLQETVKVVVIKRPFSQTISCKKGMFLSWVSQSVS